MTAGSPRISARLDTALLALLSASFVGVGVLHFVVGDLFAQIVPPPLPPLATVYASGVAELALGVLVAIPRTRRLAAWGLVLLLVAVFPANVYMATSGVTIAGLPSWMHQPSVAARWGRLPLQLVLVAWAFRFTRPRRAVIDVARLERGYQGVKGHSGLPRGPRARRRPLLNKA